MTDEFDKIRTLHCLQAKELADPRLLEKLQAMYDLLTEGVVHGDPALYTFYMLIGGSLLSTSSFPTPFPVI